MMFKSLSTRLFALTAFASALTMVGTSFAQTGGGDFGGPQVHKPVQMSFGSAPIGQKPAVQNSKSNFNTIPFRASGSPVTKNQALRTASRPSTRSPNNQPLRKLNTKQQPKQTPRLPAVSQKNKIPASPIGFSSPHESPLKARPKLQDTSQDLETGSTGSTSMAKFHDIVCTVFFIDDIKLPAQVAGVIDSLSVKEGDSIKAGTVVGLIDNELTQRLSDQARVRFEMAQETARDTTGIRAAEKKFKVAAIEANKTRKLGLKGSKSNSEVMMADYTKDIALLEQEKALKEQQRSLGEKRLAAAQYLEAQTRLKQHIIRSDYNASVIEIFKKPQEYVQPGEEVMRIARMDRLWVQGTISAADLNPHEVKGRPVTITAQLARNQTATFEGKITNVSLEAQGLTSYLVKAEVVNRSVDDHWILQPLSQVDMRIHLDGNATAGGAFNTSKER